jgi:hypothetical protein
MPAALQEVGSISAAAAAGSSAGGAADGSAIFIGSADSANMLLLPGLHKLAPERASTWTGALLAQLQPKHILLLGAVQVRGGGSACL